MALKHSLYGREREKGGVGGEMYPCLGLLLRPVPTVVVTAAIQPPPLPKRVHLPVNGASCFQGAFPCCREMQMPINPVYPCNSQTSVKEAGNRFLSVPSLQQNLFVLVQPPWHRWSSSCSVLDKKEVNT